METYTAAKYPGGLDPHAFDIDVLFWGALIFLAVFVSCFFPWKAIERLRNRRKFNGVAVKPGHIKNPRFARSWADIRHWDTQTGIVGMTSDKTGEFPLIDETGKGGQRSNGSATGRGRRRHSGPTSALGQTAGAAGRDRPPLEPRHMNKGSANKGSAYDSVGPSWACYAGEGSAMAGMNEHEEEEFFLAFGTRKHRKAIKERRKAREEAQKRS